MIIQLTEAELEYAAEVAHKRNASQRDGNRADGKVLQDSLSVDIQGAEAELAVSKAFNMPWDGSFVELDKWFDWRENGWDVSGLEVRSTRHKTGCLLLHPKDKEDAPYVLVLSHDRPNFVIQGWIFGKHGKISKYWRDVGYGRPCYFFPQEKLKSIKTLEKHIKRASGV